MRLGLLLVLALAACGRVGFQPFGDALDPDAVDAVDAPLADAGPCTGPFGPAVRLDEVNSPNQDWGGAISDDGLELFFGSDRPGGAGGTDLYVATRPIRTAPFGAPVRLDVLATAGFDDNPFLLADGLTLWFDTANELLTSTRASRDAPWQPAQSVPGLASSDANVAAALTRDELVVYFSSTRAPSTGDLDVWSASRASTAAAFENPIRLTAISTPGFDCCPQLVASEDALLFTTDQLGAGPTIGVIALDPTTRLPTGSPSLFTVLDGPASRIDVFATRDGTLLGFSASPSMSGPFDLYLMERSCP